MAANSRQVGGSHYLSPIQHWDYVAANGMGYFEGQVTKYLTRWPQKGGHEDLLKAAHYLQKLFEVQGLEWPVTLPADPPTVHPPDRDGPDYEVDV